MNKNFIFFFGVLFFNIVSLMQGTGVASADVVYLNKGEEYEGLLLKIENDTLWFKTNKEIQKWYADDIQRIDFEELPSVQSIKKLKDPLLDSLYKFGASEKDYPDASWTILYDKTSYVINSDSSWSRQKRQIIKVLKPRGKWVANRVFPYLSKSENLKMEFARVIDADGNIHWLKETATKDESMYSEFPAYENKHRIRISLPGLEQGGMTDVSLFHTFPNVSAQYPLFIEECFKTWEPIEYKLIEISCPLNLELNIFKSPQITGDSILTNNKKTYRFWLSKVSKIKEEPLLPPQPDIAPRVSFTLKNSWENLAEGYSKLIQSQLIYSDELTAKIKQLFTSRAIYNFVAKEITTIPISELSEYSWLPTSLESIYKSKSASIPDKTFLLYGMLKKAGFNVSLLLTAPHRNGIRLKEIPSYAQLPAFIILLNDSIYLCPLDDCTPYAYLPSEYQNMLALKLAPSPKIITMPLLKPKQESIIKDLYCRLDENGDLVISERVHLNGSSAITFRQNKALKQGELKKHFEQLASALHQSARLIDFSISDLSNLDAPVSYELRCIIEDYAIKAKDFLVFQLPGIKYTAEDVSREQRDNPLDFSQAFKEQNNIEIEIPEGYSVYYTPSLIFNSSESADYEAKFCFKSPNFFQKLFGGKHRPVFSDTYIRKQAQIPTDKYSDYKSCIESRARLSQEWLVIKK